MEYYRLLLCNIGGSLRWVRGVHTEDHGAIKAEGQARPEPLRNPACVSTGLCPCALAAECTWS